MYDSQGYNGFESRLQSTKSQQQKQVDPFDEMFEFELNIEKHMTPAQKQAKQREEITAKFFTDGVWLKTPEQRAEFSLLDPHSQLIATFGNCSGFSGSELEDILAGMDSPSARKSN